MGDVPENKFTPGQKVQLVSGRVVWVSKVSADSRYIYVQDNPDGRGNFEMVSSELAVPCED